MAPASTLSSGDVLLDRLRACTVRRSEPFRLSSGRESRWFIDAKAALSNPPALKRVAERALELDGDERAGIDVVGGVLVGGAPLACAISIVAGRPWCLVRGVAKDHGTGRMIEGADVSGRGVLIVDDVATTGASLLGTVEAVRSGGGRVVGAWVVVERGHAARDVLSTAGVPLWALYDSTDLGVPDGA